MDPRLESLPSIERACWRELDRASRDRAHGWHVVTLATVDGERADARSVIVREVNPDERTIIFYCDSRSPKVTQIGSHPLATLVAWSAALSWQLRIEVALDIAAEGLDVSSRWAQVKMSPTAHDYLAALPPGTPVRSYSPERGTREHFAVVTARVGAIDWLELHAENNRRARFDADGGRWLSP